MAAVPAPNATDEELEKQAEEMAGKALPASLPESARKAKLPAIKAKILERLKKQRSEQAANASSVVKVPSSSPAPPAGPFGAPPTVVVMGGGGPPPPPPPGPPPPPPPKEDYVKPEHIEGVELCGDEPWFAETVVRRRLRESVEEAHKEQKILVGDPAVEISRICPEDGRVLGAGAVLRLGGAHLGGYGESDVAYAYRQLSRALHPDKNRDVPKAPAAFHRLSEAADELREGLNQQRQALQMLVSAMGGQATAQMLERPQEALFAEASRLLSAVCGLVGEGEVPQAAQGRAVTAYARSNMYYNAQVQALLAEWFEKTQLLELYASAPVRTAYDCAPKRFRAQFLCLLNRAAIAEAKRFNDCVRGSWPQIMQTFPELGLWRDLRDAVHARVWDSSMEPPPPLEKSSRSRSRSRSRRRSRSKDPTSNYNIGTRPRDLAWEQRWQTSDDPGHDPRGDKKKEKKKKTGKDREKAIELHPKMGYRAARWARKFRNAIAAILPSGDDSSAKYTDAEVRKLGNVLWKDIVAWAQKTDTERVLRLFKADTQTPKTFGWDGKAMANVPRGMDPDTPPAEWSFVPVSDLLLVVGEGLIGMTIEGMFADNNPGHKRKTLMQCYKKKKKPKKAAGGEAKPEDTNGSAAAGGST